MFMKYDIGVPQALLRAKFDLAQSHCRHWPEARDTLQLLGGRIITTQIGMDQRGEGVPAINCSDGAVRFAERPTASSSWTGLAEMGP